MQEDLKKTTELTKNSEKKEEKYGIGRRFTNNRGYEFEIIGKCEDDYHYRQVKFLNSGYETEVQLTNIQNGTVKDKLSPSVFGVGIVDIDNATKHPLYKHWFSMIRRVYDPNYEGYEWYKDVIIDESFYYFSKYIKAVEKLENYDKLISGEGDYVIDKDLKSPKDCKMYAPNTISIITRSENAKEVYQRKYNNGGIYVRF